MSAPGAVDELIRIALEQFSRRIGTPSIVRRGRLILTAHSGGGAALMRMVTTAMPDEIHCFDALYGSAALLAAWAAARIGMGQGESSALRVLYRPGEGTAAHSETLRAQLERLVQLGGNHSLAARFRVEPTTVGHSAIPRRYGWALLRDATADLAREGDLPRPATRREPNRGGSPLRRKSGPFPKCICGSAACCAARMATAPFTSMTRPCHRGRAVALRNGQRK